MSHPRRVVVVGAGLSGLLAARDLTRRGLDVVVLDKGRGVGGRLATRRIGIDPVAVFDHGAQFFTVRSAEFDSIVSEWIDGGLVREWCRGFGDDDGHPRYVAVHGMASIAKHLAHGLDVRTDTLVFAIRRGESSTVDVVLDDASVVSADAVIVTCPLPQSYSLLVSAEVDLPEALLGTEYDRTLALLAVLDRPVSIGRHGGLQNPTAAFSWIGDNQAKGVSSVPAITFHASPAWSLEHWDDEHDLAHAALIESARVFLDDARIVTTEFKRWRFATPKTLWPEPCHVVQMNGDSGMIVLAGDAFAGPKVEGAALSGRAAASRVAEALAAN